MSSLSHAAVAGASFLLPCAKLASVRHEARGRDGSHCQLATD